MTNPSIKLDINLLNRYNSKWLLSMAYLCPQHWILRYQPNLKQLVWLLECTAYLNYDLKLLTRSEELLVLLLEQKRKAANIVHVKMQNFEWPGFPTNLNKGAEADALHVLKNRKQWKIDMFLDRKCVSHWNNITKFTSSIS